MRYFVFAFLFVLLAAPAHAQSYFAPINERQDLAQNWIDYLFKGQPLTDFYDDGSGTFQRTLGSFNGVQCALISGLGFYSHAMLMFAGFILFYHLAAMVVSTAHDGVVMGRKANQVWAPIRLVFAIGLLVPVNSGPALCNNSGAGLNAGQYIVIRMAEWGSGLASQVWNVFLDSLARQYSYVAPPARDIKSIVARMAMIEACRYAFNNQVWTIGNSLAISDRYIGGNFDPANYEPPTGLWQETAYNGAVPYGIRYIYGSNFTGNNDICGSYVLKNIPVLSVHPDDDIAAAIVAANNQAFRSETADFANIGSNMRYIIRNGGGIPENGMPDNAVIAQAVANYQAAIKNNLSSILGHLVDNTQVENLEQWAGQGWATAGAWFNTVARTQGKIVAVNEDSLPEVTPPDANLPPGLSNLLDGFATWMYKGNALTSDPPQAADPCPGAAAQTAAATGVADKRPDNGLIEEELAYVDQQAAQSGLWLTANASSIACPQPGYFTLGYQLHTASPLSELSFWGYASLNVAYDMLGNFAVKNGKREYSGIIGRSMQRAADEKRLDTARFAPSEFGLSYDQIAQQQFDLAIMTWHISIDSMIALAFFTCGFALAFIVPLMPFFRFFFNVLTWIVSLLEAVIAVPLIALAHLNPEGEGLPGPSAKAAYFLVFNLFLRPILSVFGLICGLLIFIIAIIFLNKTYGIAVAGTGGMLHGYTTLVRIIYTMTYGAAVYTCANTCFRTIGAFPEHALRWIGGQAHHERMGDQGANVQRVMGHAQSYLGRKAIDAAKITGGSGGGI